MQGSAGVGGCVRFMSPGKREQSYKEDSLEASFFVFVLTMCVEHKANGTVDWTYYFQFLLNICSRVKNTVWIQNQNRTKIHIKEGKLVPSFAMSFSPSLISEVSWGLRVYIFPSWTHIFKGICHIKICSALSCHLPQYCALFPKCRNSWELILWIDYNILWVAIRAMVLNLLYWTSYQLLEETTLFLSL